jgi:non-heme chloroperoxidase
MDHLGIDKADLFGYSLGSGIAAHLLVHHGERFDSVILGGTGNHLVFGTPESDQDQVIAEALLADDPSQITDPRGVGFRAFAEADPNNDLEALAACVRYAGGTLDPADFADVDIPVLVVNGGDDVTAGPPNEVAAAIPGARMVIIPDRDHLSVVPDERFKAVVVAFLEEQ